MLVPGAGVEPARPFGQGILSPVCLPFHHPGGRGAQNGGDLRDAAGGRQPPDSGFVAASGFVGGKESCVGIFRHALRGGLPANSQAAPCEAIV